MTLNPLHFAEAVKKQYLRYQMTSARLTFEDMWRIPGSDKDNLRGLWKEYKDRLKLLGGKGYWRVEAKKEMEN